MVALKRVFLKACLIGVLFWTAGCSFPQIIVLEDPLTPQEHLQLGLSYENRQQLELARKKYRKAADHGIPEAFLFMGNVAYQEKKYQEAETNYLEAIRKMPEDPRAYNNLAWVYYKQRKNQEKAEKLARKALELASPDNLSDYQDTLEKILSIKEP